MFDMVLNMPLMHPTKTRSTFKNLFALKEAQEYIYSKYGDEYLST